jgi:MFS family permease
MVGKTTSDARRSRTTAIRVILATLFPQFAFGVSFAWIGLAPYAVRQSHWSLTVIEAIYALTPLSSAVTFLFSGLLATKLTPRRFCWLGVGALVLGQGVAFIFPNEFTFIVFYAVLALGVGYGLTLAASLAAVAQVFPKHLGTAGGALVGAYALATLAEVPILNSLAAASNWINALRIVGTTVTMLAVLALTLMPALPRSNERPVKGIIPFSLLKQHRIATAVLLEIVIVPLGSYALSQVGIYAQDLGLVAWVGTVAVLAASLGNLLGRFLVGMASDYLSVNRMLLVLVILDAVAGILLWRTATAAVLVIAAGVVGFSCGGLVGTVPRMATDALPDAFNSILGLLFAAFALGGFIGPLLGSTLGNSSLAWLVLSLISSTGIVIIILRLIHANHSLRKDAGAIKQPIQV